jgi:2-keto-4-pentenoate hydratase
VNIDSSGTLQSIAQCFVDARLAAAPLRDFPGHVPTDLATAYRIQDAAIAMWPDEIAGWKIGRVAPEFENQFGRSRLAGPIFLNSIRPSAGIAPTPFPVFDGGFAAIEAEYLIVLGEDAAPGKQNWTAEEARHLIGGIHAGIETAGSPLASINSLGPTVVVSDFGNNSGLILGKAIADWRTRADRDLACWSFIDGNCVGQGSAADLPGGPIESLRFVLELSARRGRPLKKGMLISTGALTGIHEIVAGQKGRIAFSGGSDMKCVAVAATATREPSDGEIIAASKERQGGSAWINPTPGRRAK